MSAALRLGADRFALNAIPWFNLAADPADPGSTDRWLLAEPSFREDYPRVLRELRESGFGAAMLEVHGQQTLQRYERIVRELELRLAPGYVGIGLPEDHGLELPAGSAERVRWFDPIRRKAEESNYFGLDTIFLAPAMEWSPGAARTERSAVGAAFELDRLNRVTDLLGEAATVLAEEGVRAGLHNHIGTWVETELEIEHVLGAIEPSLLGASFDLGHLAWAGIDPAEMLSRHRDRLLDLHIKDIDLTVARSSLEHPASYRATVDRGVFQELGEGDLDLVGVLNGLPDDFRGWIIVEIDRTRLTPRESAKRSWNWVTETAS